ncbi:MAG TPA: PAS domain S-box protein [Blastocatellia bacterium]|nr:PAS domain S-box protein [Blastocatellia bacterium]
MNNGDRSFAIRYGTAVLSVAMATLIRLMLTPLLGPERVPFITYFLAVVFAAWYGGLGPAMLVVVAGSLLASYFFIPPIGSFVPTDIGDALSLAIYVVVGTLIALLSNALHRARRLAEDRAGELHNSEQSLSVTLNSIGDAVIATDTQGRVTLMNAVAQGLTGWDFQSAKGKPLDAVFNIVSEETREPSASPVARVLNEGRVVGLANHTVLLSRDGREVPIDDSAAPIKGPDGRVIGAVLIFRDITERRRAEKAVRESENRFHILANSAPVMVWMSGTDGLADFFNKPWLDYTGRAAEQEMGDGWTEGIHPDDIRTFREAYRAAFEDRGPLAVEYRLRSAGGDYRWVLDHGVPRYTVEGEFAGYIDSCVDIHDRKEAEEENNRLVSEVENQRQRLDNLVATVPGVVWEAWGQPDQAAQRINFVSDYVEKIAGYTVEEWLATPNFWLSIVHPEDKEAAARRAADLFASGEGGTNQYRWVTKDGRTLWIEARAVVIRDEEGNPIGLRGVSMDVTERKRAEESLRFLAEASGLLASSPDYEPTLRNLARLTIPLLADYCVIYIVEGDGKVRRLAAHGDPEKERLLSGLDRYQFDIAKNETVGMIYRTGQSVIIPSIDDSLLEALAQSPDHLRLIRELKSSSAMVVPLVARERTIGAIALVMSESRRQCDPSDLALAEDLARRAAVAVDNARLYRDNQEARQRLSFLVRASEVLVASLDYETTLEGTVGLAIPDFADWCFIDTVEEDGRISRVAVAAADPAKREVLLEMQRLYPSDWNSPHPSLRALRSGEPLLIPELSDEQIVAATVDAEHAALIRKINPRSVLCVPLIAHGKTLGVIGFTLSESGRLYTMKDLALAEDLARRAAVAVDNARLYRDAQNAIRARDEALRLGDELLEREQAARADAEEANRAKDEFLATVSHELRTPLNAILGWSHMLRFNDFDEETRLRALETIERNAKSQAQIIEDILDVSRIITGRLRLDVRAIDLSAVIESAINSIRPASGAKEIRITSVLDRLAGPVSGDQNRLQQVVWNLLSNAVKFTPRGGHVQVRLERTNSHVEIIIADTGQGINPEFLPYVFDRFRQADSSTTRRHGGLGLGLAIVRHLVEMHGGTVHVRSAGEGRGATFTVKLPLVAVHPKLPALEVSGTDSSGLSEVVSLPSLEGLRLLAVDDEPDTREMLTASLAYCGADVKAAASVVEALALIDEWRPHVIISDIEMPGADGYELIRRLRSRPPEQGGNTPAVALTAYARVEDRMRALSSGFQMHVAKPVEPTELAVVVANLSGRNAAKS